VSGVSALPSLESVSSATCGDGVLSVVGADWGTDGDLTGLGTLGLLAIRDELRDGAELPNAAFVAAGLTGLAVAAVEGDAFNIVFVAPPPAGDGNAFNDATPLDDARRGGAAWRQKDVSGAPQQAEYIEASRHRLGGAAQVLHHQHLNRTQ